jgi:hypothetical protein
MGNVQPQGLNINYNYFAITFYSNDKIRILAAPPDVMQQTETLIRSVWLVQDVFKTVGYTEFKLKGFPMYKSPSQNGSTKFKLLFCSLLRSYYGMGWHLKCSPVMQRYGEFGSTVIFERDYQLETSVMCISLGHTDTIRVLGPDELVKKNFFFGFF